TFDHRRAIYDTVEAGTMPPGAAGKERIKSVVFTDAAGNVLPSIDSAAGKKILRNWLACRAPVVEAVLSTPPAGGACTGGTIGDRCVRMGCELDPTWTSIYENMIETRCVICHTGGTA